MSNRKISTDTHRVKQVEMNFDLCHDTLKAIAANGDIHSAWSARKALNSVRSNFRKANL